MAVGDRIAIAKGKDLSDLRAEYDIGAMLDEHSTSHAYKSKQLVVKDGSLYTANSDIASGVTFSEGTGANQWTKKVDASAFEGVYNDGEIDRLVVDEFDTKLYSAGDSSSVPAVPPSQLRLTDVGIYGVINGATRLNINGTGSVLYSNDVSKGCLSVTDSIVLLKAGGKTRFSGSSGNTQIYDQDQDSYISLSGSELKYNDGDNTRLLITNLASQIESPDGTNGIINLKNDSITLTANGKDRFSGALSETRIYDQTQTGYAELKGSAFVFNDGTENRLVITSITSQIESPDGEKGRVAVANGQVVLIANGKTRFDGSPTDTKMYSQDESSYIALTGNYLTYNNGSGDIIRDTATEFTIRYPATTEQPDGNDGIQLNSTKIELESPTGKYGLHAMDTEVSMKGQGNEVTLNANETYFAKPIKGNTSDFKITDSDGRARLDYDGASTLLKNSDDDAHIKVTDDEYIRSKGKGFIPSLNDASWLGHATAKWKRVYAVDGTISTSDERYKKDIEDLNESYINLVRDLTPVQYRWKEGDDEDIRMGFIAQDLEKCIKDNNLSDLSVLNDESPEYLGISYTELISPMLAYIQHLEKRIEKLENK